MSEIISEIFLSAKEKFAQLGFELVGTKDINEETLFLVKEKSNSKGF